MDMFNIKSKDFPSMKDHMDLKKPGFGGPNSKQDFDKSKRTTLAKYQRVIDRNADFEGGAFNHNYDPTWKAITRDLISRQANKKPFNPMYAKQTIATVKAVEEGQIKRFEQFVNESGYNMFAEAEEEMPEVEETPAAEEIEVDQEKLENLMTEFGDDLNDLIEEIAEKMEIEKEEAYDLVAAAVKKMAEPEEEAEEEAEASEETEPGMGEEE